MKVIDLCCGAGGFSEGFRQAGFKPILGVDIWETALESYQANHHCDVLQADIRDLTADDLPDADVIIGSPPCQSFSVANNFNGNRQNAKLDSDIIEAFLHLAKKYKYWVLEEVPRASPESILWPYQPKILNSLDFGMEQHRKRLFCANFPLPKPKTKRPAEYFNCIIASELKGGVTDTRRRFSKKWIELYGVRPDEHILKKYMGFSESYIFRSKTKEDRVTQIGNAVCPPVARAIAEGIIDHEVL